MIKPARVIYQEIIPYLSNQLFSSLSVSLLIGSLPLGIKENRNIDSVKKSLSYLLMKLIKPF